MSPHILVVILADGLWLLIGVAFPLYALARSAMQGYQSGLAIRLPAKLLAILLLSYATSSAANAALRVSPNRCVQLEYGAYRFSTFVFPGLVVALLITRFSLFEPRLARKVKRETWNSRVRIADGVAGAILDVIAMVFVLDIVLLSVGFAGSPIIGYPAGFLSSSMFRGIPLINNLPSVFGGILQLEQKLHVSQSAYALIQQQCPVSISGGGTYSGIYLWTMFLALFLFAPLAFTLAFQSLTYFKASRPRYAGPDPCEECHGAGTYGPDKPLLVAALCGHCLGTGKPISDDREIPDFLEAGELMGRSLIARSYGIILIVYTVVPILVDLIRLRK